MNSIEILSYIIGDVLAVVILILLIGRAYNIHVDRIRGHEAKKRRKQERFQHLEDTVHLLDDKVNDLRHELRALSLAQKERSEKPKESPFPALLSSLLGMITKLGNTASSDEDDDENQEDKDEVNERMTQIEASLEYLSKRVDYQQIDITKLFAAANSKTQD